MDNVQNATPGFLESIIKIGKKQGLYARKESSEPH